MKKIMIVLGVAVLIAAFAYILIPPYSATIVSKSANSLTNKDLDTKDLNSGEVYATYNGKPVTKQMVDNQIESQVFDLKLNQINQDLVMTILTPKAQAKNKNVNDYIQSLTDKEKTELLAFVNSQISSKNVKLLLKPYRYSMPSFANAPTKGNSNASNTVVEFADFQCPYCKQAEPLVNELMVNHPTDLKFVYVNFPLAIHPNAVNAAKIGFCANQQNDFWPVHDYMFANQDKLDMASLKLLPTKVKGLDSTKFLTCLDSKEAQADITSNVTKGQMLGVNGTPTFFVDGIKMVGAQPYPYYEELLNMGASK